MVGKSSAPMYRGEKPIEAGLAPLFALNDVAAHAVDFWLSVEDLPDPDNRVTLDGDGNVILSYTPNNQEPMEQLYRRVKKHLSHLGMHPHHLIPRDVYMKNDIPVAGCAPRPERCASGAIQRRRSWTPTARRTRSTTCRRDTSFFEHRGGEPALTAIARLQVGDHLLERLG
jgi:hypothetical protein